MKRIILRTLIISMMIFCLTGFLATAEQGGKRNRGQVKKELRAYFDQLSEQKLFTGAVVVARAGKVIFKGGFGTANYETRRKNRPHTVYNMGSMGKAFTAVSIMMLVERGKISLDDPVSLYVPELLGGENITVHHLLRMSAGLFPMLSNPDAWARISDFHVPEELLAYFKDEPLVFQPGTQWQYCNSCYVTLGIIIERITGQTYGDFIEENILCPLNMNRTVYDPYCVEFPRRARGYDDLISEPPVEALFLHPSVPYSAGGHISTVVDLLKWDRALYTEKLVSAESLELMYTPGHGNYGYGWYIDEMNLDDRQYVHVWHWGSYSGFHSYFSRLTEAKITVILLSNITAPDMNDPDQLRPLARHAASLVLQ